MSIGAINKVFSTCPEEKGEYLVLLALADQANDDGGNIWFNWSTIAHKARLDERTTQLLVSKLIEKGRITVDVGAAPRGFDLYHIRFPQQAYTRDSFKRVRESRRLAKRAMGHTAYGRKRGTEGAVEQIRPRSENFSDSALGSKNEKFSGNSGNFSEKSENFSVGTLLPRPPSAAQLPPETFLNHPLKREVIDVVGEGVLPEWERSSNPQELQTPTPEAPRSSVPLEGGLQTHVEELPLFDAPTPPIDPHALEAALARLRTPEGVAADAASPVAPPVQDSSHGPGTGDVQATSTPEVPGGGPARSDWLAAITPVVGLLERPAAHPGSAPYRLLRALTGKALTRYLTEKTRTRGLSREHWLRLTEAEIDHVRQLAQAEADESGDNMITLALRGLDRLIGAVRMARPPKGVPEAAAQDPHLRAGQRCIVADLVGVATLGTVMDVNAVRYKIRFDDGNGRNIDRTVGAQLCTLKASDAPLPLPAAEGGPLAPEGTQWQRVQGKGGQIGEQVTVRVSQGVSRTLSNDRTVPIFELVRDFKRVMSPAHGSIC